jgi:hypothetical protein
MRPERVPISREVGWRVYRSTIDGYRCPRCSYDRYALGEEQRFERAIAKYLLRRGFCTYDEAQFLKWVAGISSNVDHRHDVVIVVAVCQKLGLPVPSYRKLLRIITPVPPETVRSVVVVLPSRRRGKRSSG